MKINYLSSSKTYFTSTSYFVMRFTIGAMMCYYHGWEKLMDDIDRWYQLGTSLTRWIGVDALAVPLGFMAAFAESIAALFIALGLLTRPMAFLMAFTMLVASSKKLSQAGIDGSEMPLLYLVLSLVILLNGSGKYSLDYLFFRNRK